MMFGNLRVATAFAVVLLTLSSVIGSPVVVLDKRQAASVSSAATPPAAATPTTSAAASPPAASTGATPSTSSTASADPATPSSVDNSNANQNNPLNADGRGQTTDTTAVKPCKQGNSPGGFIMKSPTLNQNFRVGDNLPVKWSYLPTTDTNQFPAINITIYYKTKYGFETQPRVWTDFAVEKLDPKATFFNWTVPQLADGPYVLRLVADGMDPAQAAEQKLPVPCIANGQPIPAMSGVFNVYNGESLAKYPDRYPPNSSSASLKATPSRLLYGLIVTLVVALAGLL